MLDVANTGFYVDLRNRIGHPAHRHRQLMQVSRAECPLNVNRFQSMCYCFSGFAFRGCGWNSSCGLRKRDLWYIMFCGMNNLEID